MAHRHKPSGGIPEHRVAQQAVLAITVSGRETSSLAHSCGKYLTFWRTSSTLSAVCIPATGVSVWANKEENNNNPFLSWVTHRYTGQHSDHNRFARWGVEVGERGVEGVVSVLRPGDAGNCLLCGSCVSRIPGLYMAQLAGFVSFSLGKWTCDYLGERNKES